MDAKQKEVSERDDIDDDSGWVCGNCGAEFGDEDEANICCGEEE